MGFPQQGNAGAEHTGLSRCHKPMLHSVPFIVGEFKLLHLAFDNLSILLSQHNVVTAFSRLRVTGLSNVPLGNVNSFFVSKLIFFF